MSEYIGARVYRLEPRIATKFKAACRNAGFREPDPVVNLLEALFVYATPALRTKLIAYGLECARRILKVRRTSLRAVLADLMGMEEDSDEIFGVAPSKRSANARRALLDSLFESIKECLIEDLIYTPKDFGHSDPENSQRASGEGLHREP